MYHIIYSKDELDGLSNKELLDILAKSWGVKDDKFEVWGEVEPHYENSYGFLRNPRLVKDQTSLRLYYPLEGKELAPCSFFISPTDMEYLESKSKFIKCELTFSPEKERIKHKNPFLLCVKPGSIEILKSLPTNVPDDILSDSSTKKQFITKILYDYYVEKERVKIEKEKYDYYVDKERVKIEKEKIEKEILKYEKELTKLVKSCDKERNKKSVLESEIEILHNNHKTIQQAIQTLSEEEENKKKLIIELVEQYTQLEIYMNSKINRLKSYISDKANFLKTFEFIDEEDLSLFLMDSKTPSHHIEGISFKDDLNGDYKNAVSYIQAYLVNKDILYPRHIIENYLTLLRTKDLIILAGDSGSGKTNLVKSFAEAVGGKSIIIPVKPNWTSSEDLLGYYNPLERKFLATPFLEALIEAQQNPEIPYFICLDEMNLARVEYYFADFLSLLETRNENPVITLYSTDESSHILSELKAVVDIIQSTKEKYKRDGIINFIELLKDEQLNQELRLAFGFSDKDSLIKYHNEIRRMLSTVITMPSSIKMPDNVYIIGAINIDETTHYLSPKILDRAHIMRFESPLLLDWDNILQEVENYHFEEVSKPIIFEIEKLGLRNSYPRFDRGNHFCQLFIELNKEFFHRFGIEFGMRTIRQGLNYIELFQEVNNDNEMAINNFLLHKVLPKITFDGNKSIGEQTKLELIERVFIERIKQQLPNHYSYNDSFSVIQALENIIKNAKANDGIVNFWA